VAQNDNFKPWLKYSELTQERLAILASMIRDVRDTLAILHEPDAGDRPWSFGCRAYDRTCFAIEQASKKYNWLTILPDREKPLRFTFAIGHVLLRFYHGEPDDPPSRYLTISYMEIHQRQQALDFGLPIPTDGILRIAVETDSTGRALRVSVVEMNADRNVTDMYVIPFEIQRVAIPMRARPVETPAPVIEPLKKEDETQKREEPDASVQ
jgi:hypothetical protein